jgi:hypothetical protein
MLKEGKAGPTRAEGEGMGEGMGEDREGGCRCVRRGVGVRRRGGTRGWEERERRDGRERRKRG